MSTKSVIETVIAEHPRGLYRDGARAAAFAGFAAAGRSVAGQFETEGYAVIRSAFAAPVVAAARRELQDMASADDPRCGLVYYEGSIRQRSGAAGRERDRSLSQGGSQRPQPRSREDFKLGNTEDGLPDLPAAERARYVRKFAAFVAEHPPLAALASAPELVELLAELVGEPVVMIQDMAMIKTPGGREKPWHQDHAYFNYPLARGIVGVWIALDRATRANGCMHVLAGGHRDGPRTHFMRRDWQICDDEMLPARPTVVEMDAGDLLVFDSKLPHGTPVNTTDTVRWALQYHYVGVSAVATDDDARLAVFGSEGKNVTC